MTAQWQVSGFREVRELGAGGQGRVVLAVHEETGTPVAIKYLAAEAGEQARDRLRHEAQMLGRVQSPHVARLYQLVEHAKGIAIVMEAVDGASLKEILARHGALGPEASLTVLKGSLLGLAAAHELGVVHRDYKPANVVVPQDGCSKLVDFGIAVPAGQVAEGEGTALYMAPEQWARQIASPSADVYAATCVFVECVSGRRPFTGNRDALRAAHLTAPVPVEAVPEPLRPLVARGMAKDPAHRPDSAAAFVDELERVAQHAYGRDWEARGIRRLAGAAVALAALFPLAALALPGAGAAGAGAGAAGAGAAGAAGAGAGAAGTAGAAGAGAAGAAGAGAGGAGAAGAGGTATASASGAAGTAAGAAGGGAGTAGGAAGVAGKAATAGGIKAIFGGAGVTAAVAVGTAAVVGTGAVVGLRAFRGGEEPRPTPSASTTRAVAQTVTAQPCKLFAAGAEGTAIGRPTQVQLPAQVRLPQGAGVYILDDTQKQYIIGPAGMECSRSFGASGGVTSIGEMRTGIVQHTFQGSIGGIELSMCQYFPDSAQARPGTDCSSSLRTGRNLPTGVPGTQAVIATDAPEGGQAPPSPYVSVTLATLGKDRVPMPIQCVMPWDRASICTAALTYWFIQNVKGVGQADLDRVVKTISAAVTSSRR